MSIRTGISVLLLGCAVLNSVTIMPATPAEAQTTRIRPPASSDTRPQWFGELEGRQIGVWGGPGAHSWRVDRTGRGTLTITNRTRSARQRTAAHAFALTVPEHVRFAGLIERFTTGGQDAGLCATDQAQEIIQWRGGTRPDALFNFDHGCRDAANQARYQLFTDALAILREAAARQNAA
jgi:hypothetical protein